MTYLIPQMMHHIPKNDIPYPQSDVPYPREDVSYPPNVMRLQKYNVFWDKTVWRVLVPPKTEMTYHIPKMTYHIPRNDVPYPQSDVPHPRKDPKRHAFAKIQGFLSQNCMVRPSPSQNRNDVPYPQNDIPYPQRWRTISPKCPKGCKLSPKPHAFSQLQSFLSRSCLVRPSPSQDRNDLPYPEHYPAQWFKKINMCPDDWLSISLSLYIYTRM